MTLPEIFLTLLTIIITSGFMTFANVSLREKHRPAGRISLIFAILTLTLFSFFLLSQPLIQKAAAGLIGMGFLAAIILFLWPNKARILPSPMPQSQVDERTIMFARARLEPGTDHYDAYYQNHPEHKEPDDGFRKNPGLLQPGALFYDQKLTASPEGDFFLTESLRDAVDGPIATEKVKSAPEKMSRYIKNLLSYHGARDAGICQLQPYHIYSHIGRGTGEYGAPIKLDHQFAIAFTVEMTHEMITTGPRMPAVMESARQYAEAGKIAVALAASIRAMGYTARAHIDGNYRVIAPLVAKDAGLGEIGRMGLLMTPDLGPRVRLAVVTTDLPLIPDKPTWDPTVIDFCAICKKCAEVCPSQAIPFGDRETYQDGTLRWKIDPERCYTYWTKVGTDCGRCMAVCPYSHEDNFMHNLVRYGVNHSQNFRRAAHWMDNFFYGRKPIPHSPPDWMNEIN
jgi:reductive dehalogenase